MEEIRVFFFANYETSNSKHDRCSICTIENKNDVLEVFKKWIQDQRIEIEKTTNKNAVITNCKIIYNKP